MHRIDNPTAVAVIPTPEPVGTPGPQVFTVVNPVTFATLKAGMTAAVPLPAGLWLLATGLGAVVARARRRSRPRVAAR